MRAFFLGLLLLASPTWGAEVTRPQLQTQNNTEIAPARPGGISANKLNPLLGNMIDSFGSLLSPNSWQNTNIFNILPTFPSCVGFLQGNGVLPSVCTTSITPTQVPDFIQTDVLTIASLNTVPPLSQASNGRMILLIVNGQTLSDRGASPPFTVSGTIITWSAANAGYSLEATDSVVAIYTHN